MSCEELVAIIQTTHNVVGRLRIQIPTKYRVARTQSQRRLQVYEDQVLLDGELVSLSTNRRLFLSCFGTKDCVSERVIASKVYGDETAGHRKIKKLAVEVEKALAKRIILDFKHGYWTIRL